MFNKGLVISGVGIVSPYGLGKDIFWKNIENGKSCLKKNKISGYIGTSGIVDQGKSIAYLGQKGLRNLDISTIMLLAASGMSIEDANLKIDSLNTDRIGVSTGTTFSHIQPIIEFDREVFKEGINFASPALFPSTVLNAASSQVSIRYNIQGFNTTISTGFTSSLEAIKYAANSIETSDADIVLAGGVESLSKHLIFGLNKLGYLAGKKGVAISCPYDARRNGPIPSEGAAVLCVESSNSAKKRKISPYAKILSIESCFDPKGIAKVYLSGASMEKAISNALSQCGKKPSDIDFISSCANSTANLDSTEAKVLRKVFGKDIDDIPVSSLKSMLGESFSVSAAYQMIACVGAMRHGIIYPTINYKIKDPACDINIVKNKPLKKKIRIALVISSGPGGYSSACVLERI